MIDIEEAEEAPTGAPAWMATFADLMSLLMCFFVLLLSFSEMDVLKYKQLSGSMRNAFGVQSKVNVKHIPKGTSVIAREFSPGKPEPTHMKTIHQFTTEITKPSLEVGKGPGNLNAPELDESDLEALKNSKELEERLRALFANTAKDAEKLRKDLKGEVDNGNIDIESQGQTIVIRIREKASFPSGRAELNTDFKPVIGKLRDSLKQVRGQIAVEGHTDNVPVRSRRIKSNWDLSSSRALSVAHELFKGNELDDSRFVVTGHAATNPHVPNDTQENRARNRRVEIVIRQSFEDHPESDLQSQLPDQSAPETSGGETPPSEEQLTEEQPQTEQTQEQPSAEPEPLPENTAPQTTPQEILGGQPTT